MRYVMEGSVQRADNQVRINAQLIDAASDGHIWAERYDVAATTLYRATKRNPDNDWNY
jgi:adenylate cyclase